MRQAEDIVWSAITESARRRMDFDGFKKSLGLSGDERTAEYILFQMIAGFAEKLPVEALGSKISDDLLLFGYCVSGDTLEKLLADQKELLNKEILAAEEALSGFLQGQGADSILVRISKFLHL